MDNLELDKEFQMYSSFYEVPTKMTLTTTSMFVSIWPILHSLLKSRNSWRKKIS